MLLMMMIASSWPIQLLLQFQQEEEEEEEEYNDDDEEFNMKLNTFSGWIDTKWTCSWGLRIIISTAEKNDFYSIVTGEKSFHLFDSRRSSNSS